MLMKREGVKSSKKNNFHNAFVRKKNQYLADKKNFRDTKLSFEYYNLINFFIPQFSYNIHKKDIEKSTFLLLTKYDSFIFVYVLFSWAKQQHIRKEGE